MAQPEWNPAVVLEWGDGEHTFALRFGELVALEARHDAGFLLLRQSLERRTCRAELIRDVIRFGLEGGGMKPVDVNRLVQRYVIERSPLESLSTAVTIMDRAILPPAGALGKGDGEASGAATDASPSP
ncbi:hypothetical protein ATO13_08511 [Stappia sp. 22II-S9-Z10]|nr:hypothetical protein ATO13_08511 [Stappia sp. 22II-S9-Z10]